MSTNGSSGNQPPGDNASPDPFDPAALRLSQSFVDTPGVKKVLVTVPVRKPNRQDFVRVNSDPSFRLSPAAVIELKEDRETYLVTPKIIGHVPGEFFVATLFTAMTRQGVLFIWPVRLPGPDGKHNPWHQSALEAAQSAMKSWVRMSSNMNLGAYEIFQATGSLPEPTWPDFSFQEICRIAFRDRLVDSLEHPLIQRLRGEV